MKPARIVTVLVALLLAVWALPLARGAPPSPAAAGPTLVTAVQLASVQPASPDAAGLYRDLVVVVNVSAVGAGEIQVAASLHTANMTLLIVSNQSWVPFNGSVSQVACTVHLPGPLIRLAGFNGPYALYLFAGGWTSDGFTPGNYLTNTTTTPAFTAASFAPLWADVVGPITYSTPDADHDGLSDALIAHVPVAVHDAGQVDLWGALSSTVSNGYNGFAGVGSDASRYLEPGTYTWDLTFPGYEVRGSGLDGPYLFSVYLRFPFLDPGNGAPTLMRTFTTPTYRFDGFETAAVTLRAPITASLEASGFMPAALEVLHVPLHIEAAGNYTVQAIPFAPYLGPAQPFAYPSVLAVRYLSLPVGDTSVDLTFSSVLLERWPAGQNFTFVVSAYPLGPQPAPALPFGNYPQNGFNVLWTEHNVTAALLPSRPVAWVNVTATYAGLPCPFLMGEAADLADHFEYRNGSVGGYGSPPSLNLELYPGTFELFVSGCGTSTLRTLTVSSTEALAIALPEPPSLPPDRYTMTFPSWNDSVTDFVSSQLAGPAARLEADLAGNWDGTASPTELALYVQTLVWGFIPALLTMDGSDYWDPSWHLVGADGADAVTSTAPVTVSVRYEERVPVAPIPGGEHTLTLHMYYIGNGFVPYQVDLDLPAGVGGSLNASATSAPWSSTIVPANVSVETQSAGSWRLTPGAPLPNYSFSWAVVTVTTGGGTNPSGPASGTTAGLETVLLPVALFLAAGLIALIAVLIVLRRPRGKAP